MGELVVEACLRERGLKRGHSEHWDAIRGISILIMLLIHTPAILGWKPFSFDVRELGFPAIEPIIFLSGFLISLRTHHYLYVEKKPLPTVLKYYGIRRVARTWPMYFLVVAFYFTWPQLAERPIAKPLWSFLTFTEGFDSKIGGAMHLWSMCLEEWCYLLFGIAMVFLARPSIVWIFTGLIAFAIYQRGVLIFGGQVENIFDYYTKIHHSTVLHWDSFWIGCLVGRWWYRREIPKTYWRYFLLGAFGVTALYLAAYFSGRGTLFQWILVLNPEIGALIAILLVVGIRAVPVGLVRFSRLPQVGIMAYTIYLVHKVILFNFAALNRSQGWLKASSLLEVLAGWATVIVGSYILFLILERPILTLLRTRLSFSKTQG